MLAQKLRRIRIAILYGQAHWSVAGSVEGIDTGVASDQKSAKFLILDQD